uniref:Uncharacterized protein n=1 Tax=Setaria viridis TaxID=4556 RepID=A0A4U6USC8_SETVI|nr:hypothetical protein SEVIR_5G420850v2 [Setaria viridis]
MTSRRRKLRRQWIISVDRRRCRGQRPEHTDARCLRLGLCSIFFRGKRRCVRCMGFVRCWTSCTTASFGLVVRCALAANWIVLLLVLRLNGIAHD